jgi:tetratricopeptide (TPR) repeat protein
MKKRIFLMATMMSLVSLCAFGQSAKKYYKAGTDFMEGNKFEDAIAQFTSAIGLEPSNPDYYYARGEAYEKVVKNAEAKADYEKVLVFAPKNVDALVRLGAVCNSAGNYEEALRFLNKASGIDKRHSKLYPVKVNTYIGLERYDQALKVSDTAIIIKDTPMDYYYRGVIYKSLNNEILAKKELEKAISKEKTLPAPRLLLAELLIASNPLEGSEI